MMSRASSVVIAQPSSRPAASSGDVREAVPAHDVYDQFTGGRFQEIGEPVGTSAREFSTRHQHIGVTYPRCPVPLDVVLAHWDSLPNVKGCRAVIEHHQDGVPHVHVLVQRKRPVGPLACRLMMVEYQGIFYRCNVRNLKTKQHQAHWHAYLQKEGTPVESGDYERVTVSPKARDLVDIAEADGIKVALNFFVDAGGPLEKVASIAKGLELLMKEREPRWRVSPLRLTLYAWQQRVWDAVNVRPTPRQVFWCWGPPGTGKTSFTRYLEENLDGGVLSFGPVFKISDLLFAYRGQGLVIFDFPKAFPFHSHSAEVCSAVELFSEFGASRMSQKYTARVITIQCHCLVFANCPPLEDIKHRTVVEIHCTSDFPCTESELGPTQVMGPVRLPTGELVDRGTGRPVSRSRSPIRDLAHEAEPDRVDCGDCPAVQSAASSHCS